MASQGESCSFEKNRVEVLPTTALSAVVPKARLLADTCFRRAKLDPQYQRDPIQMAPQPISPIASPPTIAAANRRTGRQFTGRETLGGTGSNATVSIARGGRSDQRRRVSRISREPRRASTSATIV